MAARFARRSPASPTRLFGERRRAQRVAGIHPPNKTIQRQQIKQPHQRLRPLDDVRHRLGLQRVKGPEKGKSEGHECGVERGQARWGSAFAGLRRTPHRAPPQKRAPGDAEESESCQNMNQDIQRVIAPSGVPADRIVDRQRRIEHGPALHGHAHARGSQRRPGRPEVADRRIRRDRRGIVENERAPPRLLAYAATPASTMTAAAKRTDPRVDAMA